FLVSSVLLINPELKAPAFSAYVGGGGPVIPGAAFPFVFITIACGAISGFHVLVSTGTTSKMVDKESDIRPIGYGGMLMEGVVGVVAIITAASLSPNDYYAINTTPEIFKQLGISVVNLPELQAQVGEVVAGRPGGAVSLAVGMAQVFILTTIDSGTRIGRFLLQEFGGRLWPKFGRTDWFPGSLVATILIVVAWAYFIWTGNVGSIWPLFGVANQLLAVVALAVATTIVINIGRQRYAWITFLPLCFLSVTTLTAGWLNITDNYWPMAVGADAAQHLQGWVNTLCTSVMMACAVIILITTSLRSLAVLTGRMRVLTLSEAEV